MYGSATWLDRDGGEDARVHAPLLERILEREAVEHGREHPRIVRRRAVHPLGGDLHAAVDVPRAEHDRRLDAQRVDSLDLRGDRVDARAVDPVLLVAE